MHLQYDLVAPAQASTVPSCPATYTASELENSTPFDFDKQLSGAAGLALLNEVHERVELWEKESATRKRQRKAKDETSFQQALNTFLANLASLSLNRIDPSRFLAVSFNTNTYNGRLSIKAMRTIRDALAAKGLIEVAPGFQKIEIADDIKPFARLTRIRASSQLVEIFEWLGIQQSSVHRCLERGAIVIRDRDNEVGTAPFEIQASAGVIEAVNARLVRSAITLPDEAWTRIGRRISDGDDKDAYRAYAGDDTAKVLRRIFSRNWERGGRIYGGWWMHIPSAERRHIQIDGEPTVECDYRQLHPTLLFLRRQIELDFDPYLPEGLSGEATRNLGKRTFQRLINRSSTKPLRRDPKDLDALPKGMSFQRYLKHLTAPLAPISDWFSSGVGMSLQREDSDLALDVLGLTEKAGIVVLPIHDSFLVRERDAKVLEKAMCDAFEVRYGVLPRIKLASSAMVKPRSVRLETLRGTATFTVAATLVSMMPSPTAYSSTARIAAI